MPSEVRWLIDNKVVYNRVWGDFSVEELRSVTLASLELWRTQPADQPMHIVTDLTGVTSHPRSLEEMRLAFPNEYHDNLGWFVLVSTNKLSLFLTTALLHLFYPQLRTRAFRTVTEAETFVRGIITHEDE